MSYQNGYTNGRDSRGLFATGNKIAAGNPMNVRMREFRTKFVNCATDADIEEIFRSLLESVRAGDTAAAKIMLEYLFGKPAQGIEIAGPEGEPLPMGAVLAVVKEVFQDDPEAQIKLAAGFHRLGRSRDGLHQLGSSN